LAETEASQRLTEAIDLVRLSIAPVGLKSKWKLAEFCPGLELQPCQLVRNSPGSTMVGSSSMSGSGHFATGSMITKTEQPKSFSGLAIYVIEE
jgi:hypothetical protein